MSLGHCGNTAVIIGKQRHRITSTIAAAAAISRSSSGGRCALARVPRPVAFPPLLLSLTPPRAVRPMSTTPSPPPPPPSERRGEEEAPPKEERKESAPSSDSPAPAAAAGAPLPPPPEMPSPGDCCGSGCVRCVWDIYYDELEVYNKLVAERRPETKKVD